MSANRSAARRVRDIAVVGSLGGLPLPQLPASGPHTTDGALPRFKFNKPSILVRVHDLRKEKVRFQ